LRFVFVNIFNILDMFIVLPQRVLEYVSFDEDYLRPFWVFCITVDPAFIPVFETF